MKVFLIYYLQMINESISYILSESLCYELFTDNK